MASDPSDQYANSQTEVAQRADLLYAILEARFAARAISKVADLGWKPFHILDINASPPSPR